MFDWCIRDQHTICKTRYKQFWFEKRKRKEVLVFSEEWTVCDCRCHNPDAPVKKAPTRRRRRK